MGFYTVLCAVDHLLAHRQWKLHHCRRQGDDNLRYYLTDSSGRVLTATGLRRRMGMTLPELLLWLDRQGDSDLSSQVRGMSEQMERVA